MQKFEREMLEAGFFLANYSSIPKEKEMDL